MPDEEGTDPRSDPVEITLSAPERALLERVRRAGTPVAESALADQAPFGEDTVRGSLQRLRSKHLLAVREEPTERWQLTARGARATEQGLPERRLLDALRAATGPVDAADAARRSGLDEEEQAVAIGVLRRRGYLEPGVPFRLRPDAPAPAEPIAEERWLARIAAGESPDDPQGLERFARRGLATAVRRTVRWWSPTSEGQALELASTDRAQLGALSSAALREGRWRGAAFRPYDVRAEVPHRIGPEPHPYARFLDEFADLLVGLGFQEAEGPLVETEFWNNDVLFMPQEHPARSVHDAFFLRGLVGRTPPEGLLERVAAVHEGRPLPGKAGGPISPGWRVPYRRELAAHPVLRSQTTAVSARVLAGRPRPPFRTFSIDRNFRPDSVDATHHVEFAQCEGILGGSGTTLRELVGVFQELADAIGIRELKLRPSYFPFTEPSVEGYVRHPRLGWIEVFPGGMLRPEVLRPLEVDVPVAAWGIGVTRLAMIALGVDDIRELYTDDLARLTGRGG